MQNDNEIIKALKCCINDDCDNCPDTFGNCEHNVMRNALDLIKRQQAEIERLRELIRAVKKDLDIAISAYDKEIADAKSEAIKEFAKRLRLAMGKFSVKEYWEVSRCISNLVEEMTEE